jgi:hypothetical protein
MPTNKARILVAQMARVWLAPVGTAAPADATVPMAAAWKDVGLFTPDSLRFSTSPNFEVVNSHQSNFATRRIQTTDEATMQVDLQEWSLSNFQAVYGGGTIASIVGTPTQYRFAPPSIGARTQVSCVIEIIDGSRHFRRVIPCAEQSEGAELDLSKGSAATLPLRLTVIGSDLGDAWYDLTDDPAFAPGP